jgi:predicted O-methyltransferase YrrM
MAAELWSAVDTYLAEQIVGRDAALDRALEANAEAGLPAIDVSALQGKLLQLLVQLQGAHSVLEIGTLGGYSTIWLARGLPDDGRLISLELDPHHADVARANIERAGLGRLVELRVGPAADSLRELLAAGAGPFDLVFIDADKHATPEYFAWALELTRAGSLIITDNVIRGGSVLDGESEDPNVQGMRRFLEQLAREPRVSGTVIQTVGAKGYDGFAIARVTDAVSS